jgi:hypothetical protein
MALKSGAPLMSSGANLVRYAARFGMRTMLYAGEKLGLNRPPRAPNEFATHIPILIGIARILPIRHVLELGCGTYSTLTFLNRTALPDLIGLDSLETDLAWAERLSEATADDPRISIQVVQHPIESSLQDLRLGEYDLILVDHAVTRDTRAATISSLTKMSFGSALVILHDYEIPQYRSASRGFHHRFEFAALTPATAVAWDLAPISRSELRLLARVIRKHASNHAPEDACSWSTLLDVELGDIRQ